MLGGVFLLGVGENWMRNCFGNLILYYTKNGVCNQIVVGGGGGGGGGEGILLVGKITEFLATVGDHNPPLGKILTYPLKNHNLLFIIKHFEHKFQKKYFCEQFSGNLSMMV